MEFNEKSIDLINDLIKINNDRAAGFEKAAKDLEVDAKGVIPIFNKLGGESRQYVTELTNAAGQHDSEIATGTSISGDLHRAWIDIKSAFTGHGLPAVLEECERGEDAAKSAYRDALEDDNELDPELVLLLRSQQIGINEGHELIKTLRDEVNPEEPNNEEQENDDYGAGETSYGSAAGKYGSSAIEGPEPENIEQEEAWDDERPTAAGDSRLMVFFINELKDLLWAERELVDTLPDMAEAATSTELRSAFELHLAETETHVSRLEQVFGLLGLEPESRKCDAMAGIVDEGDEIISATEEGTAQRDVGLIFAGQKAEHYEIASYGGMIALAKTLGYYDIAELFVLTLEEEKTADAKLTQIAENQANYEASKEHADDY